MIANSIVILLQYHSLAGYKMVIMFIKKEILLCYYFISKPLYGVVVINIKSKHFYVFLYILS